MISEQERHIIRFLLDCQEKEKIPYMAGVKMHIRRMTNGEQNPTTSEILKSVENINKGAPVKIKVHKEKGFYRLGLAPERRKAL
jgi:hypothetical protein